MLPANTLTATQKSSVLSAAGGPCTLGLVAQRTNRMVSGYR
jgi:hypothetical protein